MSCKVIELSVSAEKDMMLIIRMTTAGVLSRAGLTLDDIDDMKIAVDEACTCLMTQKMRYGRLSLRYEYDADGACVRIAGLDGQSQTENCGIDDQDEEILRCILNSMASEVTIRRDCESITEIEMKKRSAKAGVAAYGG